MTIKEVVTFLWYLFLAVLLIWLIGSFVLSLISDFLNYLYEMIKK